MKRVYKTKEKRKLNPGESHSFFILKTIVLPDGAEYFVLCDSHGEKHLLPVCYYKDYPIIINQYYNCHVDKINCQGRIFLEPVHPYYKIGRTYIFISVEIVSLKSKKRNENLYFKVSGESGGYAFLRKKESDDFEVNKSLTCKVIKLKKGKVFVERVEK